MHRSCLPPILHHLAWHRLPRVDPLHPEGHDSPGAPGLDITPDGHDSSGDPGRDFSPSAVQRVRAPGSENTLVGHDSPGAPGRDYYTGHDFSPVGHDSPKEPYGQYPVGHDAPGSAGELGALVVPSPTGVSGRSLWPMAGSPGRSESGNASRADRGADSGRRPGLNHPRGNLNR
ncbi:collagen alpha-1(III) chain-like [Homalodisca vitripennis]|uniref:collagen alpha-1(III) chain-like n=1 Tax=Homalodisca vitripennis TaxID=197043 RepID=UPI001EEC8BD7|nr:collagen alpha-1(III) chain-like [Homalodisca vitripennis]